MDQTDPWQVVPRQVFIPYSHLCSTVFPVVSRIYCLGVAGMWEYIYIFETQNFRYLALLLLVYVRLDKTSGSGSCRSVNLHSEITT